MEDGSRRTSAQPGEASWDAAPSRTRRSSWGTLCSTSHYQMTHLLFLTSREADSALEIRQRVKPLPSLDDFASTSHNLSYIQLCLLS